MAKNFSNANPHWKEMEWRAIINNQIDILDKKIKDNIEGEYSALQYSYNIYNRPANEIAMYLSLGLIKQFAI